MESKLNLSPEVREDLIRRAWYVHDARWFSATAAEFGLEAANRLNRQAVRSLGQVEAARLARALGKEGAGSMQDIIDLLEAGIDVCVAPRLMEMEFRVIDDHNYEISVNRCFASAKIIKAGLVESYECAVFDRFQGYHDALGRPLEEGQLPGSTCVLAQGRECRRTLRVKREGQ
jgi:hypothetical protein